MHASMTIQDVECSGTRDLLYTLGHEMCYETTQPLGPWYDVIDVRYILGPALLAPNFENSTGTIPAEAARSCATCFPVGAADRAERPGTGSMLFYVNKYAFQFSGSSGNLHQ